MMQQLSCLPGAITSAAIFSPCRGYRYTLERVWDRERPLVAFIGLNPSTADETADDPTIRRCVGFARDWGCGGIVMLNLFAYRATDPRRLKECGEPVGRKNDKHILRVARTGVALVACWGAHGSLHGRADAVVELLRDYPLQCLGTTAAGQPKHPLYLAKTTALVPFSGSRP